MATTSSPVVGLGLGSSGRHSLVTVEIAKHAQAGVDGDDDFRHGRHADDVAADFADEALFGAGFVIRPG